ncbi:hypothetical protein [Streptomyces violaceusniger]|uniref:hypothetical protein n=1 Tax=Streptomyces violaceusniger TaxID=68280 RepID=UPI0036A86CE1
MSRELLLVVGGVGSIRVDGAVTAEGGEPALNARRGDAEVGNGRVLVDAVHRGVAEQLMVDVFADVLAEGVECCADAVAKEVASVEGGLGGLQREPEREFLGDAIELFEIGSAEPEGCQYSDQEAELGVSCE